MVKNKRKRQRYKESLTTKKMGVNLLFSLKYSGGCYIEGLKVFCTFPDGQTGVQR